MFHQRKPSRYMSITIESVELQNGDPELSLLAWTVRDVNDGTWTEGVADEIVIGILIGI